MSQQRFLVTAALPYANGSLHLGHMVGYCLADTYVRALRLFGEKACYICASDAHGTPIEINARKQNMLPLDMVKQCHDEHFQEFQQYSIGFDTFGLTHSNTNEALVRDAYQRLQALGCIEKKQTTGYFCEHDQRFLPDRFIKGTCPRCQQADQYGDVCEKCGATYSPEELKDAKCILCHNPPKAKESEHAFFKLSHPDIVNFLKTYVNSGVLQEEVANDARHWINNGLKDWCITRDEPYFGFAVPDMPGKYFYVWLDAPFGYVSNSQEWAEKNQLKLADLWLSSSCRIEHVIGKDIMYFHTLFWPAVLNALSYQLPKSIHVHGMLTIEGEKMSKSRGTFILAKDFREHAQPETLRFYYASKQSALIQDIDLSFEDFVQKINSELVNKYTNLFSRSLQFCKQHYPATLLNGIFPEKHAHFQEVKSMQHRIGQYVDDIQIAYRQKEFSTVVRLLGMIADIGNETFQRQKPWQTIKEDKEDTALWCGFVLHIVKILAIYLSPICPELTQKVAKQLKIALVHLPSQLLFDGELGPIDHFQRLFERIDGPAFLKHFAPTADPQPHNSQPEKQTAPSESTPLPATIAYDTFAQTALRLGKILEAEAIPKSKKLLKLTIDLGEPQPRQILSGIAQFYEASTLPGRTVVVVANLAPVKIMGYESQGMILAAEKDNKLALLQVDKELAPGSEVR